MIDTQNKLNAFVETHRARMLEQCIKEFNDRPEDQEPDIWVSFWLSHEEQCDINVYQPEDEDRINITAYALHGIGPDEFEVNTQIGCLVADITWAECEDYLKFGG